MTHRLVGALPHHCIEPPRFLEQVLQEEIWPFYSLGIPYRGFAKGRGRNKLFGKKRNWALITIQKDAPNMPCNTIKHQNTSCFILSHTAAIGQTGPRKLYSLSRILLLFQNPFEHFIAFALNFEYNFQTCLATEALFKYCCNKDSTSFHIQTGKKPSPLMLKSHLYVTLMIKLWAFEFCYKLSTLGLPSVQKAEYPVMHKVLPKGFFSEVVSGDVRNCNRRFAKLPHGTLSRSCHHLNFSR